MLSNFFNPTLIYSLPLLVSSFLLLSTAHSAENVKTVVTTLEDQTEMNITVYNAGSSLVRDVRDVNFPGGMINLNFMDVAREIDPTSVAFDSLTNPQGIAIWEQNYEFDLVSRSKLLEKYIGMKIGFRRFNEETNRYDHLEGVLLSTRDGYVVEIGNKIHLLNLEEVILPQLPEGLITRPTLVWLLDTATGGKHNVEMSYLTGGLNWRANYVAVINENDTAIDLNGWVTINNTSGATYKDAKLKLVAGDLHRVRPERAAKAEMFMVDRAMAAAPAPAFEEKEFFEYYLYTLQRPATLKDNQQKQISLLESSNVPAEKLFIFNPGRDYWHGGETQKRNIQVKIAFLNEEDKGLGIPLPKGIVRVYKADTDKTLQLIGEDSIEHTPRKEEIRLLLGEAFDIIGERVLKNRRKLADRLWEYDIEVTIKNHKKDENIKVTILDSAWGDWDITKTTHDWTKKDASNFEFVVNVPKDSEVEVKYTVRREY